MVFFFIDEARSRETSINLNVDAREKFTGEVETKTKHSFSEWGFEVLK